MGDQGYTPPAFSIFLQSHLNQLIFSFHRRWAARDSARRVAFDRVCQLAG